MNIHPGESWAENFTAIQRFALPVKERVSPREPFGLGLRLSRAAADSLAAPERRKQLREFLDAHGLYAFTINGFPYGEFHEGRVKEKVYAPDWRSPNRLEYTMLLGDILAGLLPEGVSGSISTVPVSYKPWINTATDVAQAAEQLVACAAYLGGILDERGRDIALGLEPEPGCVLETTGEIVRFFHEELVPRGGRNLPEARLLRHLGVCVDTCHAAVQFEEPAQVLARLRDEGIRVAKVQLTAALQTGPDPAVLRPFAEPVYLHQVRARRDDGSVATWNDLPPAIDALAARGGFRTVRVHFHVPLALEPRDGIESTAAVLDDDFFAMLRGGVTENVELETYTFEILPGERRDVVETICRDMGWVVGRWRGV